MNIEVTSASKRDQQLARTATSVFVIGQDDIRRSGANNIPDLLRTVPGVQVAQINANSWAISVRGFNARYENKVLVLIDGRTVYTPSFSGVYWDQQDLPLEDIERIEIIRGPGSTVWGANAVNGVINIITKATTAKKEGLITAGTGSQLSALGLAQYGGAIGEDASYRTFAKYSKVASSSLPGGHSADDGWDRLHGGFRSDWTISDRDSLLLEGDIFRNNEGQTRWSGFIPSPLSFQFKQPITVAGGNMLGRWKRTLRGGSELTFQFYYDNYRRTDLGVLESLDSLDFDLQEHLTIGDRHDVVWGVGYRRNISGLAPGHEVALAPPSRTDDLYSAFLQDEIRITPSFWVTAGSKLEHNAYTGIEYEPSIRFAWTPNARHTVWASLSRAIRQPSRVDADAIIKLNDLPPNDDIPVIARLYGNREFKAERLHEADTGFRSQLTSRLSLDIDAFAGVYSDLETLEPQPQTLETIPSVRIVAPMLYANDAHGHLYGGEVSAIWTFTPKWKLSAGYARTRLRIQPSRSSNDLTYITYQAHTPDNSFQIRSFWTLSSAIEFDNALYWNQKMPLAGTPAQLRLDSRIGWKLGQITTLSIVGQNLLRARCLEFGDAAALVGTEERRSVYGQVSWRF